MKNCCLLRLKSVAGVMADAFAAPFVAATITSESQIIKHQICNLQFTVQYSKPSSFANFLSANLLIHIFKLIQKDIFDVKKWTILSANWGFTVQNGRTDLQRKTTETWMSQGIAEIGHFRKSLGISCRKQTPFARA